jgi:hypothetical protein
MRNVWAGSLVVIVGCSGSSGSSALRSPLSGPDGGTVVVGSPCVPAVETDPAFTGLVAQEVTVEPGAGAAVCLANHFQGRVTCPYGQSADGGAPSGKGCETPAGKAVTGLVEPQCADRPPTTFVTWSCRCANTAGQTNDGAEYCDCPMGTTCAQTVSSLGTASDPTSGAYCVPVAAIMPAQSCSVVCDATTHPCP